MAKRLAVEIENPEFISSMPESPANPRRCQAFAIRDATLRVLASRHALDDVQVAAANRFYHEWVVAQGAAIKAQDPTRIVVDGGSFSKDPFSERQADAMSQLRRCRSILGQHGYNLVLLLCARQHSLLELYATRRERTMAIDLLRIHLDSLATMWRMRTMR